MITVKQFLDAGFELVIGDKVKDSNDGEIINIESGGGDWSGSDNEDAKDEVLSVAWRTNTGSQPVPDDCPVIYMTSTAVEHPSNAGDLNWNLRLPLATITNWKPDLEALEMMLNDKAKSKQRIRVDYVKCEDELWHLKPDFEAEHLYYEWQNGEKYKIASVNLLAHKYLEGNVFRKVEKEIDWQDELILFLERKPTDGKCMNKELVDELNMPWDQMTDNDFIAMCHLVASLTDKPE